MHSKRGKMHLPANYGETLVINNHWSFSYPQADFTSASVAMTSDGDNIPVTLEPVVSGYGENALIWVPIGISGSWPRPQSDATYTINVQNVIIEGQSHNFSYDVIIFDPGL